MTDIDDVTRKTLRLERVRAMAMGVFESASSTFLLLILVRWFNGGGIAKTCVAAAANSGLLLAPLIVYGVRRLKFSAARAASLLLALGACLFFASALVTSELFFVTAVTLGLVLPSACSPLFTTIYLANYPSVIRGRLFARNNSVRIAVSIVFGTCAGGFLTGRIEYYWVLLLLFGAALAVGARAVGKIPCRAHVSAPAHLLAGFKFIRTDHVLRETLASWMILGFGTLMALPLRVEYLANARYGLDMSEAEVAFLVTTVPNIARFLGSLLWGRLFDTMNFFTLRIVLNVSFVVSILSFFGSSNWAGLITSSAIFGFASSGGEVAWSLWVIKFAPPEHVADYMAVHTFFTGVRGILAPATMFSLLHVLSPQNVSWLSGSLIVLAAAILVPARRASLTPKVG